MKPFFTILMLALFTTAAVHAQTNVGVNNPTPDASAALDVKSTTQGMLVPRMTLAQRNAIASPAEGLMVYQTDGTKGFYFYTGSAWTAVGGSGGRLELVATKIAATQPLSLANASNLGDLVVYDNVVTTPTIGSYSTATNAYTAGAAGLYMVQVASHILQNPTATNTTSAWYYVEVNGASLSTSNVYSQYVTNGGGGSNLPTGGYKGLSHDTYLVQLNAGDYIRIKALGENSASQQTLNNNGGCQFMVVKLN